MNTHTLKDIAGYEIEKKEAMKIINFLKNYDDYTKEGICLPKGLLLSGKPGVGKTLLASAIANESKSNFIIFNNEDDNIVLNIRKAFSEAKKNIPSILFIDELDEIVTNKYGEVTDLQKKTLQTLLTEIDGLSGSNGVLVIATANVKGLLPSALLRSGRLEKQMTMREPSYEGRIAIIDLYLSKHSVLSHINREQLAKKTEGFTGADINNLVNEVLLECKTNSKQPTIDDFEAYIPVIINKDVRRENDKEQLDYIIAHEMGHFITTYLIKSEIPSISIDRYDEVGGFVRRESKNKQFVKLSSLEDDLTILLGGIAGERAIMNDMTLGASSDVKKAYDILWESLNVGMFGFEYFYTQEREMYRANQRISDSKLMKIEAKVTEMFDRAVERGIKLIQDNMHIYNKLVDELKIEGRLSTDRIKILLK